MSEDHAGTRPGKAAPEGETFLDGVASMASRIVHKAASVLEEEVAAGMAAARQVEQRLGASTGLFQAGPDGFGRREAQEVVEALADFAGAAARTVGTLARQVVAVRVAPTGPAPPAPGGGGPHVVPAGPAAPGGTAEGLLSVENSGGEAWRAFRLACTDLLGAAGDRIPSKRVRFDPPSLDLAAGARHGVRVLVEVPPQAAAGAYTGLLQGVGHPRVQALLFLQVG